MAQPITLSLFDSKPATSGFIHQSVSTSVQFLDESTQTLDLLVTQLHSLALIVLTTRPPLASEHEPRHGLVETDAHILIWFEVLSPPNDRGYVLCNSSTLSLGYHTAYISSFRINS